MTHPAEPFERRQGSGARRQKPFQQGPSAEPPQGHSSGNGAFWMNQPKKTRRGGGAARSCLSFPTCTTGGVGAVTGLNPSPALAPRSPCTKAGHQQPGGGQSWGWGAAPQGRTPLRVKRGGHQPPRRAGSPAQLSGTSMNPPSPLQATGVPWDPPSHSSPPHNSPASPWGHAESSQLGAPPAWPGKAVGTAASLGGQPPSRDAPALPTRQATHSPQPHAGRGGTAGDRGVTLSRAPSVAPTPAPLHGTRGGSALRALLHPAPCCIAHPPKKE